MKIKTPPQVTDPTGHTASEVVKHLQAVTDDIRNIMQGGLSFKDAQLPFQIVSKNVTNNVPIQLSIQQPFSIGGAFPILTNGSTILSFKTNIINGILTITLNMDISPTQISFLVVGTGI